MPSVQDIFHLLAGSSIFSRIDMASSFFQIPVKPEHRERLAFSVPDLERWQFVRSALYSVLSSASSRRTPVHPTRQPKTVQKHCFCQICDRMFRLNVSPRSVKT